MSMEWCRLWHDMPTDPKFRTIARVSGQPLATVVAVFTFMLVDASKCHERGVTRCDAEDIGSALDLIPEHIKVVLEAMQGRVLEGNKLSGWEKRNPTREDNSSDRTRTWREARKSVTQCDAAKRKVTLDTDTDKTREEKGKVPVKVPEPRLKFGEFGNVRLTVDEHMKLIARLNGSTDSYINRLDLWGEEQPGKFKQRKSHYATILTWHARDLAERKIQPHQTGAKPRLVL